MSDNVTDPSINRNEHSDDGGVLAKRTKLYGWYPTGGVWNRVQVDANGILVATLSSGAAAVTTVYQGGAPWLVNASIIGNLPVTATYAAPWSVTATVNQGTSPWTVNDDMGNFEAKGRNTLTASTDTTISFSETVRLVRVKNFDTSNVVMVANATIASDTATNAERVGVAPVTNVPSVEYYPYKTSSIHVRSAGASSIDVTGFF